MAVRLLSSGDAVVRITGYGGRFEHLITPDGGSTLTETLPPDGWLRLARWVWCGGLLVGFLSAVFVKVAGVPAWLWLIPAGGVLLTVLGWWAEDRFGSEDPYLYPDLVLEPGSAGGGTRELDSEWELVTDEVLARGGGDGDGDGDDHGD